MKLWFVAPFLSIKEFPNTELPPFTLVTGVNGVGKTHLLRSIAGGSIGMSGVSVPGAEIRHYDWNNLAPNDTEPFDGRPLVQERLQAFNYYEMALSNYNNALISAAQQAGLSGPILQAPARIRRLTVAELTEILGSTSTAEAAHLAINAAAVDTELRLIHGYEPSYETQIRAVATASNKRLTELTHDDFLLGAMPNWGHADPFQQSFGRLFVAYRDLWLNNELRKYQVSVGRQGVTALSDNEFVAHYMGPPWSFVNEALSEAELDFEIDRPDEYSFIPYRPSLTKRSNKAVVRFGDLSSGERILMSLALSLYYAQDKRQLSQFPKVLLLDEVDAPLHPSMCKTFIKMVTNVLVRKYNIGVIATTHSAATVALAPEDSIFVMHPDKPGLHKTSKSLALNILTVGVPTLALSYDGRRQVIVESPADSSVYDLIYQVYKARLASERSLEFISSGGSPGTGIEGQTGCAAVSYIVEQLAKSGNLSVFGLVDWDGKNSCKPRLRVLAYNQRNGLENVILDPLLLTVLLARDFKEHAISIGYRTQDLYPRVLDHSPHELQTLMAIVQQRVFQGEQHLSKVPYVGGFELLVDERFLVTDDHKLEEAVVAAFPPLNSIKKGPCGSADEAHSS